MTADSAAHTGHAPPGAPGLQEVLREAFCAPEKGAFAQAAAFLRRVRASRALSAALHGAISDALLRGNRGDVLNAKESVALNAGETDVLNAGESDALNAGETDVLNAGESDALNAGETDVLNAGESDVLQTLAAHGALLFAEPEVAAVLRGHFARHAAGRYAERSAAVLRPVLGALKALPAPKVASRWAEMATRIFAHEYAVCAAEGLFDAVQDAAEDAAAANAMAQDVSAALADAQGAHTLMCVAAVYARALRRRLLHAGVPGETIAAHLLAAADVLRTVDASGFVLDRGLDAAAPRVKDAETAAAVLSIAAAEPYTPAAAGLPAGWTPDPPGAAPAVRVFAKAGRAAVLSALAADALPHYRGRVLAPALLSALAAENPKARRAALTAVCAQAEGLRSRMAPAAWAACAAMLADAERAAAAPASDVLLAAAHVCWPWGAGAAEGGEEAGTEEIVRALAPGVGRLVDRWRAGHGLRALRVRPEHSLAVVRVDYASGGCATHAAPLAEVRVLLHVAASAAGRVPLAALVAEFPAASVCASVDAWARRGVLLVDPQSGLVSLAEAAPPVPPCDAALCGAPESPDAAPDASPDATVLAWPYVHAMLTNLGAHKAERIHAMLAALAPDCAGHIDDLQALLDAKVRQGALLRSAAGAYSLAP